MRSVQTNLLLIVLVAVITSGCAYLPSGKSKGASDNAASVYVQLGVNYMEREQYDTALKKLNRALQIDPRSSDAHSVLGILYNRIGKMEKAEKHYKRAVKLDSSNSGALNNYGQFLCQRGETAAAVKHFLQAADDPLYKTPEIAYTNAGVCEAKANNLKQAEIHYRKALTIDPNVRIALYRMASLSNRPGRYLQARGYLQRYLEKRPTDPRALWLGVQIERQLGDADAAASYALSLRSKHPDSQETRLLLESESDKR